MKGYIFLLLSSIACLVILFPACTEETKVGYGLVEKEDLDILYKDDFQLLAKTVTLDPEITSISGLTQIDRLFLGEIDDPTFGELTASAYFSPTLVTTVQEFEGGTFDSAVLTIVIDTNYYGVELAEHNISIYELTNSIDKDTLTSSETFEIYPDPIGSVSGVIPNDLDSISIPDLDTDSSTVKRSGLIRVPLNDDFGMKLFSDTAAHASTTDLRAIFGGIQVVSETENSLFQMRNISYVSIYYHAADGDFIEYRYALSVGPLTPKIDYDYGNTEISSVIDVPITDDGALYAQGLGGADITIDISDVDALDEDGIVINHASLELVMDARVNIDTMLYPIADLLILQKKEEGQFVFIEDISLASNLGLFGGSMTFDSESNTYRYEMNITTYLVNRLRNNENGLLYLRVSNRVRNPRKAVLLGPNHSQYPMRLKLTYTKI